MIAGVYRPGQSLLHRYDPRVKLINVLTLMVFFFLPLRLTHLALYLAAAALLIGSTLGVAELWRPIRMILPILILVLVLTPPFHRTGPVLIVLGRVTLLTEQGLRDALRLLIRFAGITLVLFAHLRTTEPEALVLSFRWYGLPFGAALVLSIASQYIPNFKVLYDQVQDAHRLRQVGVGDSGANGRLRRPGVFRRVALAIPALTSVLILSVRRIPVLAMVLETRGVGRPGARTTFRALPSGRALLGAGLIGLAVEAALIATALLFP